MSGKVVVKTRFKDGQITRNDRMVSDDAMLARHCLEVIRKDVLPIYDL